MNKFLSFGLLCLLVAAISAQDFAAQKAHLMCIIETKLSSDACKNTAKTQVQASTDAATGCATLETFKGLLTSIGCTQADYDLLHQVICEHVQIPCSH